MLNRGPGMGSSRLFSPGLIDASDVSVFAESWLTRPLSLSTYSVVSVDPDRALDSFACFALADIYRTGGPLKTGLYDEVA